MAQPSVINRGMITVFVMLATVMQVLDTTIANVALPHMQGSLSATQDQIAWVLTSYIVASAIMTPPTGWLVGHFGRKKIFLIAIVGFTMASVLCGIAQSIEEMVLFRILQGVFGAALVPLSQSTLLDINPKEKHGTAMALWGMGIMVGPILGPTLGGYLTEYYNWRWVFYINLPIGVLSFLGILTFLPETEKEERPFNVYGFLSLSLTIGALQLIVDRGEQVDWFSSKEILIYCGIMVGSFWVFIFSSFYSRDPFLNFKMFRDSNFVTGLVLIFFVGVILLGTMTLLPPYMENIMGYPVVDTGILMAPRGVGTMISMFIVGRTLEKVGSRNLVLLGLVLTAFSLHEMSQFNTFVPQYDLIYTGVLQGLGIGFIFVPLSTVAFSGLPLRLRTEATSLFSLMRNLGSSIGVSIVTMLLARNTQMNHSYLGEAITAVKTDILAHSVHQQGPYTMATLLAEIDAEITRQASTIAFLNDFSLMMWMVIALIPLVFLLKKPNNPSQDIVVYE